MFIYSIDERMKEGGEKNSAMEGVREGKSCEWIWGWKKKDEGQAVISPQLKSSLVLWVYDLYKTHISGAGNGDCSLVDAYQFVLKEYSHITHTITGVTAPDFSSLKFHRLVRSNWLGQKDIISKGMGERQNGVTRYDTLIKTINHIRSV